MRSVAGIIAANYSTDNMGVLSDERGIASAPFGGRYRLVDFALSNMVNSGITTVGIIMPYKYRSLIDHIGTGSTWALDRKFGGMNLLPGTAFGMTNKGNRFTLRDFKKNVIFLKRIFSEYVLVTTSNCVANIDYNALIEKHIMSNADITMACVDASIDIPEATGINTIGDRVMGIKKGVRKGESTFMDTFILSRDLLLKFIEWYSSIDYMDIFEVIRDDYDKINIKTWKYNGYARGIFDIHTYYQTSMDLLNLEIYKELFTDGMPIRTKAQDCVPARYWSGSSVRNSLVSSGCNIEGTVENSILFRGVKVEKGAVVRNSIIMQSCIVRRDAELNYAIIDRNNFIGKNTTINGTAKDIFIMEKDKNK